MMGMSVHLAGHRACLCVIDEHGFEFLEMGEGRMGGARVRMRLV